VEEEEGTSRRSRSAPEEMMEMGRAPWPFLVVFVLVVSTAATAPIVR
jgi:hypothetical protein